MFTNTYQQGWSDAVNKRPKSWVGPSDEYRDGYHAGERYRIQQRVAELVATLFLAFLIGVFMTLGIARLVQMPV